jgi:Bacteriophage probable baseplate hub protein
MAGDVDPQVYPARPRFFIDGQEQVGLSESLLSLQVEETSAGLYRCEATFANWGAKDGTATFLYFDRQLLDFGKKLRVEAGGGVGAGQVFEGKVTGIEGRFLRERPHEVLVFAEDRLQDLRMTRRTRTFEDMSDADLFQQVASQHGLRADVDVSGPTHKVLAQLNQSDLAFLRERARAVDAEVWVAGDTLFVKTRSRRNTGDVTLTLGRGLLECSVTADLAGQVSAFSVSGWDVAGKEAIAFRATDSALSGELGSDEGGSAILSGKIGDRPQQIVHLVPFSAAEAQALAEANYRRAARRFVIGNGIAEGDARVRVGAKLSLQGVGPLFEGKYYVTRARHLFDPRIGFRTQFMAERPGIGRPS